MPTAEEWMQLTRKTDRRIMELFSVNRCFSEHLTRWTDDRIPDKHDQNFFYCSGQPTPKEYQRALAYQRERGDNFIKLESDEALSDCFGMATGVTLTMALPDNALAAAWRELPKLQIRRPHLDELTEHELRNVGKAYGEDFTIRNARRNYEKLVYYGAYLADRLVCACYVYTDSGCTCIDGLITDEPFRRRGIATTLLRYIVRKYEDTFIYLHADEEDTPREMYRRMGFEPVDRRYEYSADL